MQSRSGSCSSTRTRIHVHCPCDRPGARPGGTLDHDSEGPMRIVVPRETAAGERRVALVPETVGRLVEAGLEVGIEAGAGERAGYLDQAYADAGATIVPGAAALY